MRAFRVLSCVAVFLVLAEGVAQRTPSIIGTVTPITYSTYVFRLKTDSGHVVINPVREDGTLGGAIFDSTWSSGWTTVEFYTIGDTTYRFRLKAGDGTATINAVNPDGTGGPVVGNYSLSSGWTTAQFYAIEGNTYLFMLKYDEGRVVIYRMRPDGTIGDKIRDTSTWSEGWSTVRLHPIGGSLYMLRLKVGDSGEQTGGGLDAAALAKCLVMPWTCSSGLVKEKKTEGAIEPRLAINRMNSNGTIGTTTADYEIGLGWTSAQFYTIGDTTYLFRLKAGDGQVRINRVLENGTFGSSTIVYDTFWSSGWTIAEFYRVGDTTYLFRVKGADGTVRIDRINAYGLPQQKVWESDWTSGWTIVRFYSVKDAAP